MFWKLVEAMRFDVCSGTQSIGPRNTRLEAILKYQLHAGVASIAGLLICWACGRIQ